MLQKIKILYPRKIYKRLALNLLTINNKFCYLPTAKSANGKIREQITNFL